MDRPQLVSQVHQALPQTQCTRCGYPDCLSYAKAIVCDGAPINQCPPGGREGIQRLATITQREVLEPNETHGQESPRNIVWIDEDWCIGCTLCIKACPVDAIVGVNKWMHSVLEPLCTGCELCIPACPVDCIVAENASGTATGWQAWSASQADAAHLRHENRQQRLKRDEDKRQARHLAALQDKAQNLSAHSQITDAQTLEKKRSVIEQALTRARERQTPKPTP